MRHVFLRGEFCSKKCFDAYKRDESSLRDWQSQGRIDDQGSALTPNGELERKELSPVVVQLQQGGAEIPLYFIGAELPEFRLAQLMGPGHSIFGVSVPWPLAWRNAAVNNELSALPTVEQLAAPYSAALRDHAGTSPSALVGYSFAGLIAFETARQLQAQGGKVEMVILLDSRTKYPTPHQVAWQKLQEDWKLPLKGPATVRTGARLRSSWLIFRWMVLSEIRLLGRYFLQAVLRDPGQLTVKIDEQGKRLPYGLIERVWLNAAKCYHPRYLDCRGVLFRADIPADKRPASALDPTLGWNNLFSRGLEVIQVPGDHITMMRQEPHNLMVAQHMNELLNRFASSQLKSRVGLSEQFPV